MKTKHAQKTIHGTPAPLSLNSVAAGLTFAWLVVALPAAPLQAGTIPAADALQPMPITLGQLAETTDQLVEFEGLVRAANMEAGRLELSFNEDGEKCVAFVMGPFSHNIDSLVGARVKICGLNVSRVSQGHLLSRRIVVRGTNLVKILEPSSTKVADLPVLTINKVQKDETLPDANVRICGTVREYHPGSYVVVQDSTGTIRADIAQVTPVTPGENIVLWGTAIRTDTGLKLDDAGFRCE